MLLEGAPASPPSFLRLAADPARWRLLSELAFSDRRVGELADRVGQPQNLVSYHLAQLRSAGIVRSRRSQADGRDAYYAIDLARCRELLTQSGLALHPGLRLAAPPGRDSQHGRGRRRKRQRVLFLCSGNSARSQIAEALVRHLALGEVRAFSAGSHPKPLHPNAVRVMRARGIDLAGARSKPITRFDGQRFDYVVSLCDRVREVCPEFPEHPRMIHWSIPDPAREGDDGEQSLPAFERTAAELAERIPFLLELIQQNLPSEEVT
jgi:ArsR family transcriptional regulator, arsenate/arsenite/antimonite-responsive transcriptional repressor / arsenate reductase (thioredoxin)